MTATMSWMRLACAVTLASSLLLACDPGAPASFPPEEPALTAENQAAGDPYGGRFPLEAALAQLPESGELRATIHTDQGDVHCRLLADVSPLAVANFIGLARGLRPFFDPNVGAWVTRPYYDGLPFHRAEERLFVQTGRLAADESVGYRLQDERSIGTAFDKPGVLALGNRGQPNSSAAQFFITTAVIRAFDGAYTIIGRCEDPLVVRELEGLVVAGQRPMIQTVTISRE